MTTVGLISDTHALIRPEALDALRGSDVIVHAGDVGDPSVLDALRKVAPVTAVRGNVDRGPWGEALPIAASLEMCGLQLYVLHILADIEIDAHAAGISVVVSGHTHKPIIEKKGPVLYVNPGSAGPRRFSLPVSVGFLKLEEGREPRAWLYPLGL